MADAPSGTPPTPPALEEFHTLRDPRLRRLLAHWLGLAGGRVPSRDALDPLDIPYALPICWLCDLMPDEGFPQGRFRYRLAGDVIERIFGRSLRGVHLDELVPPADWPRVEARWLSVLALPAIGVHVGTVYDTYDTLLVGERLLLPLLDRQGRATIILGATAYETADPETLPGPLGEFVRPVPP
ncbi:MAG TPA: PAS domain-containing protein [Azospirillaceae bacterium]|nr:PAS domain-containing protein [Azospirillaceae bacterium]